MTKNKVQSFIIWFTLGALLSCSEKSPLSPTPISAPVRQSMDMMLTESQQRLANITTQKVSRKLIGETRLVNGRLKENEELSTSISSRVAGRIEKLFVKETGRMIKKGEPLYEIYSESLLTLQQEYLLAKEQTQKSDADNDRYEALLKAAEKKLLLFGLPSAQINRLSKSNLTARTTFSAPVSGAVKEVSVVEGQSVAEGDRLFEIEDLSSLWLEAELYPNEIDLIDRGDEITTTIVGFEQNTQKTKIIFLSPEYEANNQIVVMRSVLKNPQGIFKPGMQANIQIGEKTKESLSLPTGAVIRTGTGAHVYVQTDNNTFQPRNVQTGLEDFEQVEITSGLKQDEVVVVTGAYLIYSEFILKRGINPAEHIHQ